MKVSLLVFALSAAAVLGCGAPVTQSPMREVQSTTGGFAVLMPVTSSEEDTEMSNAPPLMVDENFLRVDTGREAFLVTWNDFDQLEGPAETILDGARDSAFAEVGGSTIFEETVSLEGFPGRALNIDVAGGELNYRSRVYLVGLRLYQVTWTGPLEESTSIRVRRFFDSFRLLEQ